MEDNDFDFDDLFYHQMNPKEDEDLHFGTDALDAENKVDENGNPVNPNQAPGLDPNTIPEENRMVFRHADPGVHAEFSDNLIQPCSEEPMEEEEKKENPPESTTEETETAEEGNEQDKDTGSEEADTTNETDDSSDDDEPLLCPNCGQELSLVKVGDKVFYKHTEDQANACASAFPSKEAVMAAINQQKEIQEAIKAAEEEDKRKKLEEAKQAEEEEKAKKDNPAGGNASSDQTAVYMEIFSKQLSNIMQSLGEIKAKETQLDKINAELAALKTEVQALSQEKEAANLKEIAGNLDQHTENMKDLHEKLGKAVNHISNLEDDIKRMKEAERDLLLVTDNAGQQFNQFINSVEMLRKTDIQLNNIFPLLENFIKLLDSEYTAKLKTYSEKQAELGNHFKKQSEKFLKETSKRMKFEAPAASSPGIATLVIPTIISFVLMFILKYIG